MGLLIRFDRNKPIKEQVSISKNLILFKRKGNLQTCQKCLAYAETWICNFCNLHQNAFGCRKTFWFNEKCQ